MVNASLGPRPRPPLRPWQPLGPDQPPRAGCLLRGACTGRTMHRTAMHPAAVCMAVAPAEQSRNERMRGMRMVSPSARVVSYSGLHGSYDYPKKENWILVKGLPGAPVWAA